MMLSMIRHIPAADSSIKAGKWDRAKLTGKEVFNKNIGIIGLGKVEAEWPLSSRQWG